LIIDASAAAAKMQSKVGGEFEILDISFHGGEMVKGQQFYHQSAVTASEISGRVASATYINEQTIPW
jgi:hypothetical protein